MTLNLGKKLNPAIGLALGLAILTSACGSATPDRASQTASSVTAQNGAAATERLDWQFDSNWLVRAGENAKAFWYSALTERSTATTSSSGVQFAIYDARDPRLYPPGAPLQPPTPADKAVVKIFPNGNFVITALIIDRPGYLALKEFPNGNRIIDISFDVERLAYGSRFDGLFASASRFTSGAGWNYLLYLRGFGNQISSVQFDAAVMDFLRRSVLYVTPL